MVTSQSVRTPESEIASGVMQILGAMGEEVSVSDIKFSYQMFWN